MLAGGQADAADGIGVADHAEIEVVLQGVPVVFDLHVVRGDGGEGGDARHHIGQVAEGVLQVLGRLVGHLGKGPEGGHIDEGAAIELADVAGPGDPLSGGDGGGLTRDAGQP